MKIINLIIILIFNTLYLYSQDISSPNQDQMWVDGVCGMCEKRIEKAAKHTKGVIEAHWDQDNHILSYEFDKSTFQKENLEENLLNAGHDLKGKSAPNDIYQNLPPCCHYRDIESDIEHGDMGTHLTGTVFELDDKNNKTPLLGAYVFSIDDNTGVTTDRNGNFEINLEEPHSKIIVSFIGYKNDTIDVDLHEYDHYEITLSNSYLLDEIHITYKKRSTDFSYTAPYKVETLGLKELKKAACCNLSESFETNPSVDVSYTDAVTGAKVIELLGLAGKYVQITKESMPYIRGLSSVYGMSFTPGPWIESIQLIKGTGSVINGYESMTGQINLEFFKPENRKPLFINLYTNEHLASEINLISNQKISDKVYTGLFFNMNNKSNETDKNNDGFMDEATGNQINIVNRWKFYFPKNIESQLGIMFNRYNQNAGQLSNTDNNKNLWTTNLKNDRLEAWMKIGKIFEGDFNNSIGFQLSSVYNTLDSRFGNRIFDANQKSLYGNLIYQTDILNSKQTLKSGISVQLDDIDEDLSEYNNHTQEITPGIFTEYSFIPNEKITLVTGLRLDHSNYYGFFVTPRLNIKYAIQEKTVFRVAFGRGQRTSTLFSENIGLLSSSRKLIIEGDKTDVPYGLDPEVVWNFGINFLQEFEVFNRNIVFTLDFYRSQFVNQIVIDLENPREAVFYNLDGKSYSNSIQTQLDYELVKNLDIRLAYRFNEVKTQYKEGLLEKPLVAKNRAFLNIAYTIKDNWKFDYTLNWQGAKRLPNTDTYPEEFRLENYSPDFFISNCQITKEWKSGLEIYLGAENLFNFKQENAILSANDPYNDYFDATMIWGPIMGRKIYLGVRYDLK
ncbi:MAG: carboxypeptidase-like regulatory domain-containing protein [Saprospiraceae bacterium]